MENAIEECNEESLALTSDFEVNGLEKEVNKMNFTSGANLEDHQFNFFIKHLDKDVARKHLVSVSQDTHFSEIRCENIRKEGVDLQKKLTKLCSEISCKQQLLLGETLDLTIKSMSERIINCSLGTHNCSCKTRSMPR